MIRMFKKISSISYQLYIYIYIYTYIYTYIYIYLSGVILMMIKHVKIRSYCMVPQIQGPNIFDCSLQNDEFGNEINEFDIS